MTTPIEEEWCFAVAKLFLVVIPKLPVALELPLLVEQLALEVQRTETVVRLCGSRDRRCLEM